MLPDLKPLSKLLHDQGYSNLWLARATGYSVASVRAWRTGRRKPSHGASLLIARALKLKPWQLAKLLEETC